MDGHVRQRHSKVEDMVGKRALGSAVRERSIRHGTKDRRQESLIRIVWGVKYELESPLPYHFSVVTVYFNLILNDTSVV